MTIFSLAVHLFLPHHSNNHRPKALHIDALFIYVLLFGLFYFGTNALERRMPDVLGYATDIHVEKLIAATNAKRQAAGLAPLSLDAELSEAARKKAADMFAKNYWAHNSPTGRTPWEFVSGAGYSYTVAGENLAKNFSDSQSVVDAWMASSTHRDNLMKVGYRDIGFAVVNGILNGEETTLVVQMFGSRVRPQSREQTQKVTVPLLAAVSDQASAVKAAASAYSSVTKKPWIDLGVFNRTIVYVFIGVLLGVFGVDAWLTRRRRIVRVSGHSIAHIAFFVALLILISSIQRGSLL
ncbi:MAG: CAP domain-containing protein [Patescibacteria group bacterium]